MHTHTYIHESSVGNVIFVLWPIAILATKLKKKFPKSGFATKNDRKEDRKKVEKMQ